MFDFSRKLWGLSHRPGRVSFQTGASIVNVEEVD
jgi:hypothetical protein